MKKKIILFLITMMLLLASIPGCIGNPVTSTVNDETTTAIKATESNTAIDAEKETETQTQTQAETPTAPVETEKQPETQPVVGTGKFDITQVPAYSGKAYAVINNNNPYFTKDDMTTDSYETYAKLDALGRCGVTIACVGKDIMPTEDRGSIGSVKPTGWHTVKYDCVDGKYLYNRCHLIGFQLTGENANTANLITGTRYLNVDGMLPFENMVADYVKETNNHVMYRVTPIFEGSNLVATGVLMEAKSVEDDGDGILFCVFCYNVQPGVTINYATGESALAGSAETPTDPTDSTEAPETKTTYILNTSSKKFHLESCSSLPTSNRQDFVGTRDEVVAMGYSPCGRCKP